MNILNILKLLSEIKILITVMYFLYLKLLIMMKPAKKTTKKALNCKESPIKLKSP